MLFNSLEFLLFLPIVFILYWFVFAKNLKAQNFLILVASYIFYGWWDWRFLSLIAVSTIVDYIVGIKVHETEEQKKRKYWIWVSVAFNLGLLGFFKYYNFFVDSFINAFASIGYHLDPWTLNIVLPVGISFYTFQTMSYTLDIYKKQLEPTKDIVAFAAFVSFFPQLVAGPIERASMLLPQILQKRTFSYPQAVQGLRLMLWGFFKKVVIADTLAPIVNNIFGNYEQYTGGVLLLGAIYFAFQIYCDFSGYSDIARGIAKILGFELMLNFNFPYFSRSIGEFWRRWHISLSTWFRDYLYIPLGGSRVPKLKGIRNIFIIFLVSGFWHGANWTFVAWGGIHAALFIPSFIIGSNRKHTSSEPFEGGWAALPGQLLAMGITFVSVVIAWVFFRAPGIHESLDYIRIMVTTINVPTEFRYFLFTAVIPLVIMELFHFSKPARNLFNKYAIIRFIAYFGLIIWILFSINNLNSEFIYFQF